MSSKAFKEQGIPLILTVLTFFGLSIFLYLFIQVLNIFPGSTKIVPHLRIRDVLVGLTIYLKTSIDFAIFIGNVMRANTGWRKRIAIELGTAVGNATGTLLILLIWNFFREVPLLMVVMIILASLVLLRMAEESLSEFLDEESHHPIHQLTKFLRNQLATLNKIFKPVLGKLIPNAGITNIKSLSFWNLAIFSFMIPFILGLDDFAGYIPLFSIINVFGFSVGVFLGHMILNVGLFINPNRTTKIVRLPVVLIIGGVAFIAIAFWGFYEAFYLLTQTTLGFLIH